MLYMRITHVHTTFRHLEYVHVGNIWMSLMLRYPVSPQSCWVYGHWCKICPTYFQNVQIGNFRKNCLLVLFLTTILKLDTRGKTFPSIRSCISTFFYMHMKMPMLITITMVVMVTVVYLTLLNITLMYDFMLIYCYLWMAIVEHMLCVLGAPGMACYLVWPVMWMYQ